MSVRCKYCGAVIGAKVIEKLTLEEVKNRTGCNNIVSYRITEEGHGEITDSDGDKKLLSSDFKIERTLWHKSRRITEDGLVEITHSDGEKMLYSPDYKKRYTDWFEGNYIVENGIIYITEKREIGRVTE